MIKFILQPSTTNKDSVDRKLREKLVSAINNVIQVNSDNQSIMRARLVGEEIYVVKGNELLPEDIGLTTNRVKSDVAQLQSPAIIDGKIVFDTMRLEDLTGVQVSKQDKVIDDITEALTDMPQLYEEALKESR